MCSKRWLNLRDDHRTMYNLKAFSNLLTTAIDIIGCHACGHTSHNKLVAKGVGRHRQGGGAWPPGPKILSFWPLKRPKIGVDPPRNWKMAGEPSPGAPESPPLEKFLPTPLLVALFSQSPISSCLKHLFLELSSSWIMNCRSNICLASQYLDSNTQYSFISWCT